MFVAESSLLLLFPAFGSGVGRVPGGLLLRTAPTRDGLRGGTAPVLPFHSPEPTCSYCRCCQTGGIPEMPRKATRIAPKGDRPLAPHERLRRDCLWMAASETDKRSTIT